MTMPSPTSQEELLPCPFCGSAEAFVERADYSSCYVICNDCGARGPASCDETDADADASESGEVEPGALPAIRLWNARLTSAPAGWRPIEDAPRDGTRMNLCWKAFGGISAHVELGKWSPSKGWCNTYGHPFSGDPDYFQPLPQAPTGDQP